MDITVYLGSSVAEYAVIGLTHRERKFPPQYRKKFRKHILSKLELRVKWRPALCLISLTLFLYGVEENHNEILKYKTE
jgi:hypothetical protein